MPKPPDFAYTLEALVPDSMMPEDVQEAIVHLETLTEYFRVKARAMRLRATGKITFAEQAETTCDALYGALPGNWQW